MYIFSCQNQITCVIFLAAIDEFDTYILPDNKVGGLLCWWSSLSENHPLFVFQRQKNKLVESLEVFAEIQNNPCLKQKTFILFLNKVDVFREKILNANLIDHFSDFPGIEKI